MRRRDAVNADVSGPDAKTAKTKTPKRPAIGSRGAKRPQRPAARRSALPPALPRPAKLARGRTHASPPPAHIRVFGAELTSDDRETLARKLGMKLGKFASSIERVTVRVADVNGPRGGVDHRCLIKVVLSGLPSVVVEQRDAVLHRAIAVAIDSTASAVRRSLQRRRSKPLQSRKPRPAVTAS